MNLIKKTIGFILISFLCFPSFCLSQESELIETSQKELLSLARDVMTSVGTCALITVDGDGIPRVRTMEALTPEEDFTVWFGTNPKSRKVEQIKNNPKVTLYYYAPKEVGYVTIHGTAMIIDDQKEKEKRWKDGWERFYPDKTKDYTLIKVDPIWLEAVSISRGIISNSSSLQPPKVIFD